MGERENIPLETSPGNSLRTITKSVNERLSPEIHEIGRIPKARSQVKEFNRVFQIQQTFAFNNNEQQLFTLYQINDLLQRNPTIIPSAYYAIHHPEVTDRSQQIILREIVKKIQRMEENGVSQERIVQIRNAAEVLTIMYSHYLDAGHHGLTDTSQSASMDRIKILVKAGELTHQLLQPPQRERKNYHEIDEDEPNWEIVQGVDGWRYGEAGYEYRIGVPRNVMENPKDLEVVETILATPFGEIVDGRITRNLARIVVTRGLLDQLRDANPSNDVWERIKPYIEAVIPLDQSGNEELRDCVQIIFGKNDLSRQSTPTEMHEEIQRAVTTFESAQREELDGQRIAQIQANYDVVQLTNTDKKNPYMEQLAESYKALLQNTFDETDLQTFIDDPDAIVLVVVPKNNRMQVVSGVYASKDKDELERNGKKIPLTGYEIEGAVTDKDYRGHGIYTVLSLELLSRLANSPTVPDVVFGYSNATDIGVLKAAAKTGRILSAQTATALGLSTKPAEQQDFVKNLNGDGMKYVDDILTFIPGNSLRERYAKQQSA